MLWRHDVWGERQHVPNLRLVRLSDVELVLESLKLLRRLQEVRLKGDFHTDEYT